MNTSSSSETASITPHLVDQEGWLSKYVYLILTQDQRKLCDLWSTFLISQLITNHIHPLHVPNNPTESKDVLFQEGYVQNVQKPTIQKSKGNENV